MKLFKLPYALPKHFTLGHIERELLQIFVFKDNPTTIREVLEQLPYSYFSTWRSIKSLEKHGLIERTNFSRPHEYMITLSGVIYNSIISK